MINPYFHTFGLKAGLIASLSARRDDAAGAGVRRGPRCWICVERERITMLPGPPTLYHSLLTVRDKRQSCRRCGLAVTGAADIPVELVRRIRGRTAVPDADDRVRAHRGGQRHRCRGPATPSRTSRPPPALPVRGRRGAHRRATERSCCAATNVHGGVPGRPGRHRAGDRRLTAGCTRGTSGRVDESAG